MLVVGHVANPTVVRSFGKVHRPLETGIVLLPQRHDLDLHVAVAPLLQQVVVQSLGDVNAAELALQ